MWLYKNQVDLFHLTIMLSRSTHVVTNARISFFFYGWILFLYVFFIHSFIHWWTLRLFPLFTANHAALNIAVWISVSRQSLVQIISGIAASNGNYRFDFFFFGGTVFHTSAAVPFYCALSNAPRFLFFHIHSNTCWLVAAVFHLSENSQSMGMKWCISVVLIYISLMMTNTEHPFRCLLAICIYLEKSLLKPFAHFWSGLPVFSWLSFRGLLNSVAID